MKIVDLRRTVRMRLGPACYPGVREGCPACICTGREQTAILAALDLAEAVLNSGDHIADASTQSAMSALEEALKALDD